MDVEQLEFYFLHFKAALHTHTPRDTNPRLRLLSVQAGGELREREGERERDSPDNQDLLYMADKTHTYMNRPHTMYTGDNTHTH